jgi:hypothetical protein
MMMLSTKASFATASFATTVRSCATGTWRALPKSPGFSALDDMATPTVAERGVAA